jgi:hypothetical protein
METGWVLYSPITIQTGINVEKIFKNIQKKSPQRAISFSFYILFFHVLFDLRIIYYLYEKTFL